MTNIRILSVKVKRLQIVVCVACLSACAQTHIVLYEQGRPVASAFVQGDSKNLTLKTATCEFHADELLHSPATVAGGQVVTSTTSYLGGIATILRFILPFFP